MRDWQNEIVIQAGIADGTRHVTYLFKDEFICGVKGKFKNKVETGCDYIKELDFIIAKLPPMWETLSRGFRDRQMTDFEKELYNRL